MIKLFVSDMDGTLLNEDHIISERTANAIKALQSNGIEFMVATGRTYPSAKPLLDTHNIQGEMINLNGAATYNAQGKLLRALPMDYPIVEEIFAYLNSNNINYSIMTAGEFYTKDVDGFIERLRRFFDKGTIDALSSLKAIPSSSSDAQFIEDLNYLQSLDNYILSQDNLPLKIMLVSSNQATLHQFKDQFDHHPAIDITSSGKDNLEVTSHLAQKGLAVQTYIEDKGYTMDEVATIGDSLNDRSMLQMAGHSYAMENASDEVKAFAKYEAPSHREDGVAQVIEDILNTL